MLREWRPCVVNSTLRHQLDNPRMPTPSSSCAQPWLTRLSRYQLLGTLKVLCATSLRWCHHILGYTASAPPLPPQQHPSAVSDSDLHIQLLQAQIAQLQANQAAAARAQALEAQLAQLRAAPPVVAQPPATPNLELILALLAGQPAPASVPAPALSLEAQLAQLLAPPPLAQSQVQPNNVELLRALLASQAAPATVQPQALGLEAQLAQLLAAQSRNVSGHSQVVPKPAKSPTLPAHAPLCTFYQSARGCHYGSECKRRHDQPGGNNTPPKPQPTKHPSKLCGGKPAKADICPFFNAPGGCTFSADKCKKLHIVDPKAQAIREQEVASFAATQSDLRANVERVRQEMKAAYDQANRLDLVIVMDCTSSMGPWIKSAKDAVTSIITNIQVDHPNANVRAGFVGYRDYASYTHAPLRVESHALTTNIPDVHAFISTLQACGGRGNFADIPGGIAEALDMPWESDAKVMILVGDAPCHGQLYHDRYTGTMDPSTPCIQEQMRTIARRGIDFRFIEIQPENTAKMVAILQAEYMSTLASDGLARSFATVSLAASGDVVKFGDVVRQISTASLTASKSRSVISTARQVSTKGSTTATLVKIGEDDEADDDDSDNDDDANKSSPKNGGVKAEWAPPTTVEPLSWPLVEACPEIAAFRYCVMIRLECNNLSNPVTITTKQPTTIKLVSTPFAKGAMRTAHGMQDTKLGLNLVAKFYFGTAATMDHHVRQDVEMHAISKRLAKEFSKSKDVETGVDFITTCWYEVKGRPLFTAEPYIPGDYTKYNNNSGWVGGDGHGTAAATANDSQVATAQAFSHFTYQHTKGQLMIVDLQGVGSIFTDPQIHSLDATKYGHGNLGQAGITSFFATHKCNRVCRALHLTPFDNSPVDASQLQDDEAGVGATPAADKTMTCSCGLCGGIFTMFHSGFVAEINQYPDVHCPTCKLEYDKSKTSIACLECGKAKTYSLYWYKMKGMSTPKYCSKVCKAAKEPTKKPSRSRPWQKVVYLAIEAAKQPDGWSLLASVGNKFKQIDPTFSAKDHAANLMELLRSLPNVEIRENAVAPGVAANYSARLK
ncbi:hypothetical protein DYB34_004155 [Aphanomyces astaci]|uniref:Alpha-type protein kinase domain-containing protein n=1 Tax=Aphanomyces astaci TaxID=112090 RepID=A0A418C3G2_APHAT|nr:hypothetical protein DYB34_004155 [Aphanomyces astaci]